MFGNVCALCIRVMVVLILCVMSWGELMSRFLSVFVGFLNASILRSLPCRVISISREGFAVLFKFNRKRNIRVSVVQRVTKTGNSGLFNYRKTNKFLLCLHGDYESSLITINFVETPRKFIITKLSIRKLRSSSLPIIMRLICIHMSYK